MKRIIILLSGIFLLGCSQDNPEAIKKQIAGLQNKVNTYNEQIESLKQQLEASPMAAEEPEGTVVRVQQLSPEPFAHYIQISGKVIAEEEAFISPEMNGQIEKIHVEEGQRVVKGQKLISLNTDLTQASIKEVETNMELLQKLYEKQKELWGNNIGSEVQYLQAKTNLESAAARLATLEEQLDMASVTAPFNGIVEDVMVKEGEMAMPGGRMIHLVNLKNLSIEADVSEAYLNDIRKGEKVEVEFPTYPGMLKELPIQRVGSVIENLSRTFQVELALKNPDEKIKPNQLAVLKVNDFYSEEALVVPSIIVKQDITGYYVYRVADGIAEKIYVTPGHSAAEMTMIDEGLETGMEIIVDGFNLVKSGSRVRIVN